MVAFAEQKNGVLIKPKRAVDARCSNGTIASAFDRAFRPEIVHEAHFHLKESHRALKKNERDRFSNVVTTALQRVQRFGEYPGWRAVKDLHKSAPKDAYEIAMDLIEAREATGTPWCAVTPAGQLE